MLTTVHFAPAGLHPISRSQFLNVPERLGGCHLLLMHRFVWKCRHSIAARALPPALTLSARVMDNPEEYLDQAQIELEKIAPAVEYATGVDRRAFVWRSLVTAAAGTFAAKAVHAQTGILNPMVSHLGNAVDVNFVVRELLQAPQQAAPFPLGNGEAPAEQFMPYPGGTGALLQKMYKERGVAAFERSAFNVPKWEGTGSHQ